MVVGIHVLPVPERPTSCENSKAKAYCACSRCGLGMFGLSLSLSLSLSLAEAAWYILKYCLKDL